MINKMSDTYIVRPNNKYGWGTMGYEITDADQEVLAEIVRECDYQGYKNGKYIFEGQSTGVEARAEKRLGLPGAFKEKGAVNLFAYYDELRTQIFKMIRGIRPERPEIENDAEKIVDGSITNKQYETVASEIAVFKTPVKDLMKDPGAARSGGFNLILMNTTTRHIINPQVIDYDSILYMKKLKREEISEDDRISLVYPKFDPMVSDLVFDSTWDHLGSRVPMQALNTAVPPKWMMDSKENLDWKPRIGNYISRLINHLFTDEEERERVLDWCHYAIFKRNGTVLCLAGDRGTGKSMFTEILSHLVGLDYSEIVNQSILEDKFNSQMYNKRLIMFEEVALRESIAINKIKAWCNHKINIEMKGMDSFTASNWSSMIFLMNDLADLQINAQERRFSVPSVAEQNLKVAIPVEEIEEFMTEMQSQSGDAFREIAEFGLFLKDRVPKMKSDMPIKGKHYYRVADTAMSEWQAILREYLISHGEIGKIISIGDVFPPSSKDVLVPKKRSTFESFLSDYRYMGVHKLASVVPMPSEPVNGSSNSITAQGKRSRRAYGIMPNAEFLNEHGLKYKLKAEDIL